MSTPVYTITDYTFFPPAGAFSWFYVGDFGAIGDGITDDSQSINNAIAAATANSGGTVLLGPYNYEIIANPVTINASNVNLMGMGQGTTVVQQGFTTSNTNNCIVYLGPNSNSCLVSDFTIKGPGLTATGTLPGPTTPNAPQLGSGWGLLAFQGKENTIQSVGFAGCYHGVGVILFGTTDVVQCSFGMGGLQLEPQYGICFQGPAGSAATGTITLSGTPTTNDTLSAVLDDGQGNVTSIGPYTLSSSDVSSGINHTAASFANFMLASQAFQGPTANWGNVSSSGPNILLSIDIPAGANTPTYSASSTGVINAAPTATTAVLGGTRDNNPVSQVGRVQQCVFSQAQAPGGARSTECVHIDGGTVSIGINNVGSTGAAYTVRSVNQNSGSDKGVQFCDISQVSCDHTGTSGVSIENGNSINIDGVHCIAGFPGGSPPVNWSVYIGPNVGEWNLSTVRIESCAGGGIGIATGSGTLSNFRIQQVGEGKLPAIGLIGAGPILGLTIKSGKLGSQNLFPNGGQFGNASAIDLVGTGVNAFTGTLQSFTIEDVDMVGPGGSLNAGTALSGSLATFGLNTGITIKNNPGLNPITTITQPTAPSPGLPGAPTFNPFFSDCDVLVIPDGTHAVTSVTIETANGSFTRTVNLTTPFNIMVPANAAVMLSFLAGTVAWEWFPT